MSRQKRPRFSRFVLFVGDDGAILIHLQGDKVAKRLYAPNPEAANVRPFRELLGSAPGVPLYMMVDMMDQSYVRHDLPPVSAMSVNKLIKRRLDRDFAAEDIKGAIRLGRDTQGRKDWNYLLISLANTGPLASWLELALDVPNRFRGIFLVPVEAQQFIVQLSRILKSEKGVEPSPWQILVSHNKVGGFRQVVVRDNKLVFTRLAQPVGETTAEVIAGNIEQEVLSTIEYIKRLSYNEQAGLDLFIIVSQEIKNAIDAGKFKATNVMIYTPFEGASKLKIEQAALPGDHFGDVLLAASFGASRKHVLKLSTPYTRKLDTLHAFETGVRAFTGIAACGLVLYSASLAFELYSASSGGRHLQAEQKMAEDNLARVQEQARQLPIDINRITETLDVYQVMAKDDMVPFDLIAAVSETLQQGIALKSFKWAKAQAGDAAGAPVPSAGAFVAALGNAAKGPTTTIMEIQFTGDTGNTDLFVQTSNAFFNRLRERLKNYTLTVSQLPGTVTEAETLKLSYDDEAQPDGIGASQPVTVTVTLSGPLPERSVPISSQATPIIPAGSL